MSCTSCSSIGRYTRDLPLSTVDSLIQSALAVWARASGLTFVRLHTSSADIRVEFVTNGGFVSSLTPNADSRGHKVLTAQWH